MKKIGAVLAVLVFTGVFGLHFFNGIKEMALDFYPQSSGSGGV